MSITPSLPKPFARLRDVFAFYHQSPTIAATALELEDCTYDAARAALAARVPFAALCLGQAMTRLAAEIYERRAAS